MHRPTLASTLPLLFLMASARLPTPARSVAITIDDLPVVRVSVSSDWASVTDRLLTTLKQHNAPAIGFVNESKLYDNGRLDSTRVALLQDWLNAGEELGNHTFAHIPPDNTPLAEYLDGIQRGEVVTRALAQRAGRPFRYFRHPLLHTGRSRVSPRGRAVLGCAWLHDCAGDGGQSGMGVRARLCRGAAARRYDAGAAGCRRLPATSGQCVRVLGTAFAHAVWPGDPARVVAPCERDQRGLLGHASDT